MPFGIKRFTHFFPHQAIRAVVIILSALIFHGITLDLKLALRNRIEQKAHSIRLKPQHFF
ncbi:Uncharacterised protein [Vibrio cholerae]|nr:Uncharacterised protein [Vibrio cholerae]CSD19500.1 Uncharacterised protein [Vibrio cholerae]